MRNSVRIIAAVILALTSVAGLDSIVSAAPPSGSISGTVYETDGKTPVTAGVVNAYDYSLNTFVARGYISGHDGSYTISGLDSGDYKVQARADGYYSEYYNNAINLGSASRITVTAPNDRPNINFSLAQCGSISGAVSSDDGTPIYSGHILLFNSVTHERVDETWMASSSNAYRVGHDLPSGSYHVRVEAVGYFSEYCDNVTDIESATPVSVTAPNETPGINFNLTLGGIISGTVSSDNGTPIYGAHVLALASATHEMVDETWMSSTSNAYRLGRDLPSESYHIRVEAVGYFSEYYNNVTEIGSAAIVSVTVPNETREINFMLNDEALHISAVGATSIAATTATITWTTDQPASSQVDYGLTASYGTIGSDSNLVTSHSVTLTGLTSQTTYHYRVTGADGEVPPNEASSEAYTFTTLDITAPAISSVNASKITGTSATVTWTTDETASSQVEYGPTTSYGSSTTLDLNMVTNHSVNLTGLTSQTTYHYRVKSADGSGNSISSGDYTLNSVDITAPGISAVSVANIAAASATITWSTDEEASSQVEYGLTATCGSRTAWDSNRVHNHSVDLTGLESGSTYHYRVISIDVANNRAVSEDNTFTTSARSGVMPIWAWVLVALAAVAVAGAAAYLIRRRLANQQQP